MRQDGMHLNLIQERKAQEFYEEFHDVIGGHARAFDSMKVASINSANFVYSEPSKYSMVTLGQDEMQVLVSVYCELYLEHKATAWPWIAHLC